MAYKDKRPGSAPGVCTGDVISQCPVVSAALARASSGVLPGCSIALSRYGYTRSETRVYADPGTKVFMRSHGQRAARGKPTRRNPTMRRFAIFTLCLLALAACASADVFNFTYTGTKVVTDVFSVTPNTNPSCDPNCSGASGQLVATFVSGNQWQVNSGSGSYTNPAGVTLGITIIPG